MGIVTSGLVYNIDAGDPTSYKPLTGGTGWNDTVNGTTGTFSAAETYTRTNYGFIAFSGSYHLNVSSQSSLNDIGPLTICFWIKSTSVTKSETIMAKTDGGTQQGWYIQWDATFGGGIGFYSPSLTNDTQRVAIASAFATNTWMFIAITWDGTTTATGCHIYRDGNTEVSSYVRTNNGSGTHSSDASQTLFVAGYSATLNGCTDTASSIPLVHIYNRVITGAEITQNWDANVGRFNGAKIKAIASVTA